MIIIPTKIWSRSIKLLKRFFIEDVLINTRSDFVDPKSSIFFIFNPYIEWIKDKIRMNQTLDSLQILHPPTFYSIEDLLGTPDDQLLVVKHRFESKAEGIGFYLYSEIKDLSFSQDEYFQIFIPFEKEYRVLITKLGVISTKKKIPRSKCYTPLYKNIKTCKYVTILNSKLEYFCKKIINKINVHFVGMDVGIHDHLFYLIELNSCPGLTPTTAEKLVNHFKIMKNEMYSL